MSSTNKTTHYELPQFVENDIFNPLVDDNDAYDKIDTALHNIADAEADDAAEIVAAKGRLDTIEGKVDNLETQNGTNVLTTVAQTLSGAVNELKSGEDSLDGRLDVVEDDINNVTTGLKVKVAALEQQCGSEVLETTAQTLSGAVNEIVTKGLAEPYAPIKIGEFIYTNSTTHKKTKVKYAIIDKAYKPRLVMAGDTFKKDGAFVVEDVGVVSVREKATVACNASSVHSSWTTSGTVIIDGDVKHINDTDETEWGAYDLENLYMTADGTLHVIDAFASIQEMTALSPVWSFNGFTSIYKNGAINDVLDRTAKDPHTVIAQNNLGDYLVMTTGGRKYDDSGMDFDDIVDAIMNTLSFNAVLIYNCDGGGSSALLTHQIRMNELIDATPRKVPTMLVFCADVTDTYSDYESGYSEYISDINNKKVNTNITIDNENANINIVGQNGANEIASVGISYYKGIRDNSDNEYDYTRLMKLGYSNTSKNVYLEALDANNNYREHLLLDYQNNKAELLGKQVMRGSHIYTKTGSITTSSSAIIDSNDILGSNVLTTDSVLIEAISTDNNIALIPFIYNGRYLFVAENPKDHTQIISSDVNYRITWITGMYKEAYPTT